VCYDLAAGLAVRIGEGGPVRTSEDQESDVAKGQMRSNREKKKPKADKNKVKAAPAASPFASSRVVATHPRGKGGKPSS
jgi:hypothetical protein